MSRTTYEVLQDTRNELNPNLCSSCQAPIKPVYACTTNVYHICVYECKQCGAMSFTLSEIFREDDEKITV